MILLLFVVYVYVAMAYAFEPPHLLSGQLEVTVNLGENASLQCPVANVEFYQWFKGRQKIDPIDNRRLKVTNKGVLRIQRVIEEDAGHYRCEAINGFGVAKANVTLVVLVNHALENENRVERDNYYPDSEVIPPNKKSKPKFKEGHPKDAGRVVQRSTESSVIFKCHPHGNPTPTVEWYKEGARLRERDKDSRIKIYRWRIEVNYLKLTDSGVYTCVAKNGQGVAHLNHTLKVTRAVMSKSEFMGQDPVNTTVYEGGMAYFQCRVRSSVKPYINWLKLVPEEDLNKIDKHRLIPFDGIYYQVLNSTEVSHPDGTFLNKLHIEKTAISDTGKYVCLAANTQGYIYRVAHLQIIKKSLSETGGNPITVIVVVSLTSLILLACAVGALRYVRFPQTMETNKNANGHFNGSGKRLIKKGKDISVSPSIESPRVKVHHHPKTHHHHYHQHSHHLGELKY